jgi:hypothetical protein
LSSKVGVVAWPWAGMCVVAIGIGGGIGKVVAGADVIEKEDERGKIVVEVEAMG